MVHVIIVVVLVLLIVGGGSLWIKRKRRLQREDLERRWKISEGDVCDEPAVEKKRGWFRRFKAPPPVPPDLMLTLSLLPELTDRLLRLYKDYQENIELVYASAHAYAASMKVVPAIAASDLAAFGSWWSKNLPLAVADRRNGGEFCRRFKMHFSAHRPIELVAVDLRDALETIEEYGLNKLPPDQLLTVDLAKRVLAAVKLKQSFDLRVSAPNGSNEPDVPHAEAEGACRRLFPMLQRSVPQVVSLLGCLTAAEEAKDALDDIADGPELADPQHPSAEDVQAWLAALDRWTACKRDLELAFSGRLAALKSAYAAERDESALQMLSQLREWHLEASAVIEIDELVIRRWFISDEAEALHGFAGQVTSCCQSVVERAGKLIASAEASDGAESVDAPLSEADEKRRAYVMSAVRKLGFAVAQSTAAKEKFNAAEEEAKTKPERPKLCLEAANADAFIAAHKRWCEAVRRHHQASEDRSFRIGELRKQRDERSQQVQTAVAAVNAALTKQQLPGGDACLQPAKLADTLSIALLVQSKYKYVPAQVEQSGHGSRGGGGSYDGSYASSCGGGSFL